MLQGASAAAGVARAASKLSLSGDTAAAAPAPAQPHLADKERLAAAIAVKQKVLKLLQKQKEAADPASRATLQHKLDKILGKASSAQPAAAAEASLPSTAAGQAASHFLKGAKKQQQKQAQMQQQRQPLAGIAPVLAITAAEQVRAPV